MFICSYVNNCFNKSYLKDMPCYVTISFPVFWCFISLLSSVVLFIDDINCVSLTREEIDDPLSL